MTMLLANSRRIHKHHQWILSHTCYFVQQIQDDLDEASRDREHTVRAFSALDLLLVIYNLENRLI